MQCSSTTQTRMMQHGSGYFAASEDDHSALLAAFPIPLPLEDTSAPSGTKYEPEETRHQPDAVAPFPSTNQFSANLAHQFTYHDPLQAGSLSGQHLPDFDKQGRNDQMKLTFIMDAAESASKKASAAAAAGAMPSNQVFPPSASATPTHVQDFAAFPALPPPQAASCSVGGQASMAVALVPSHTNKRMQACSACDIVFAMKSKALYHLYVHHPESAPAKVYPCTRCENAFLRKSDMVSILGLPYPPPSASCPFSQLAAERVAFKTKLTSLDIYSLFSSGTRFFLITVDKAF